jgi:hypothetical protein
MCVRAGRNRFKGTLFAVFVKVCGDALQQLVAVVGKLADGGQVKI